VTSWQRDEWVEARAAAILADGRTAQAYAAHFEAQMDRGPARKLLALLWSGLRMCCRSGVAWVAVILVPCGLLGYTAASVHLRPPAPGQMVTVTAPPGPPAVLGTGPGSVSFTVTGFSRGADRDTTVRSAY
jgi:hypothetical protein